MSHGDQQRPEAIWNPILSGQHRRTANRSVGRALW